MTTEEKFAAVAHGLDRHYKGAMVALAELRQEIRGDYEDMRRFQARFIAADHECRELRALIAEAARFIGMGASEAGGTGVGHKLAARLAAVGAGQEKPDYCETDDTARWLRAEDAQPDPRDEEIRRLRKALESVRSAMSTRGYQEWWSGWEGVGAKVNAALAAPKAACRWCADGKPEWSYDAKVWIHRRDRLDRVCENPPNNYGYTTQVPEETISGERRMEPCKRCGGTRSVRVKNRLTFDTDSAAERELAYDNVPCPNCQPDRRLFTFDRYEADSPVSDGIASARAASVAEALAKVQGEYPGSTFRLRGEE
jgi:hypothetical protein